MDSLDGLKTFAAVVDAGSFTAAAERLHISKKLASKYIQELEARLGATLLHRTTRALSLTSAGRQLYPRAVSLLSEYDAMTSDIRTAETGLSGVLRVSAPVTFGESYVMEALRKLREAHPDLSIDLHLNDRYVDVAGEGFDLAVRIGRLEDSGLMARRLGQSEFFAVATPAYLTARGTPQHPKDLAAHSCIRDSNFRGGQSWPFNVNGSVQRVAVQGNYMVNSATAVRSLVLQDEGIGFCPDWVVAEDIAAGRLVHVLGPFSTASAGIYAVFHDARRMPARTRAALDCLVGAFAAAPWRVAKDR